MLDPHLLQQLRSIEQKYHELLAKIQSPIDLSHEDLLRIYRDINSIEEIVNKFRIWNKLQLELLESERIIQDSEIDLELQNLASIEVLNLQQESQECERELRILLLPKDPHDDLNVILEVRAITGGDEAGIWAEDLVRMYTRYAQSQGWKVKLIYSWGEIGFSIAMLEIIGDRVYSQLKFESGIHEVQRRSFTELTNRKIINSTATIL